jgi:hypothetical protein
MIKPRVVPRSLLYRIKGKDVIRTSVMFQQVMKDAQEWEKKGGKVEITTRPAKGRFKHARIIDEAEFVYK